MGKTPVLETTRVLNFGGAAANAADEHPTECFVPELTVGGRRYRLVPVDVDSACDQPTSPVELLTPRELQVVALVAEGHVNKQVADVLRISEWTVSTHLRRIFAKLGVDTRAAMVSRCFGAIASTRK
jgi:DNA-binding CsgD family transcriptional regulator